MNTDSIEREITIAAPVDRVWSLITEAEHLGTWFGDSGAEIDLRPGGALKLNWEEHGSAQGRIEAVEPTSRFAFRWAPFKNPGGVEPQAGNSTLVEFTLAAAGEGTRLKVVESGFDSLDATFEQRRENHAGNTEGWQIELGDLADYAARVAV